MVVASRRARRAPALSWLHRQAGDTNVTDPFLNTGRGDKPPFFGSPTPPPSTPPMMGTGSAYGPPSTVNTSSRAPLIAMVIGLVVAGIAGLAYGFTQATQPSDDPIAASPSATPTAPFAALPPEAEPVAPGQVTDDPRLPAAMPLPAGLLDTVAPDWLLGVYTVQSDVTTDDGVFPATGPNVLYLASPAGDLYQVLELSRNVHWRINYWDAAANRVLMGEWEYGHTLFDDDPIPPLYVWVDLATGKTSVADLGAVDAYFLNFLGTAADGRRIWLRSSEQPGIASSYDPQQVVADNGDGTAQVLLEFDIVRYPANFSLSPDRTRVAAGSFDGGDTNVVTIASGEVATFPYDISTVCADGSWLDDQSLVSLCFTGKTYDTFDVAARDATTGVRSDPLASGDSAVTAAWPFGTAIDGTFIYDFSYREDAVTVCGDPQYVVDGEFASLAVVSELNPPDIGFQTMGKEGNTLFLIGEPCSTMGDDLDGVRLVARDFDDGSYTLLFPPANDIPGAKTTQGLTSIARLPLGAE